MHILLTGGGSGGHVTPLLAVAHEIKKLHPDYTLSYIGEKGGKFGRLVEESNLFEQTYYIQAGKFRRYHDESLIQKILDVKTNALNLRDACRTLIGCLQALRIVRKLRPNVLFAKGGFVSVPVGLAAHVLKVPFLTHDSDAVPGLANRIIGRWAQIHATGLPTELYTYPQSKAVFVGVPVSDDFKEATDKKILAARERLSIPTDAKVVLVTGGSQGSVRINESVKAIVPSLLQAEKNTFVLHHVGQGNQGMYKDFIHERLQISEFYNNFSEVATAADIVVTRAGANSMAEFGLLQKAAIVIPSPFLAGGHQMENAKQLASLDAIKELDEQAVIDNPDVLLSALKELLNDENMRNELAENLHKATRPHAAQRLAELVVSLGAGK